MAQKLSPSDVKGMFEKLSNWGRWGKDDQRGALNFITNQKRAAAARLVQTGESVSMALPLATIPAPDNPTPVTHLMVQAGADSRRAGAALCRRLLRHRAAWNGEHSYRRALPRLLAEQNVQRLRRQLKSARTAQKNAPSTSTRAGIVSRGVLLDIPRLKKIEWMEPRRKNSALMISTPPKKRSNVRVDEGDVLLVRTGRAAMRKVKGGWDPIRVGLPGLDAACLPWLHERRIAVLGCDAVSDVVPSGYAGVPLPIHVGTLVAMGIHLIDNADLDARVFRLRRTRPQRIHVLDGAVDSRARHRLAGKSARDLLNTSRMTTE